VIASENPASVFRSSAVQERPTAGSMTQKLAALEGPGKKRAPKASLPVCPSGRLPAESPQTAEDLVKWKTLPCSPTFTKPSSSIRPIIAVMVLSP
jgi:hypothetical protein